MGITYSIRSVTNRYKIDVIFTESGRKFGTFKWFLSVFDAQKFIDDFHNNNFKSNARHTCTNAKNDNVVLLVRSQPM
jgi:hypothetical protein